MARVKSQQSKLYIETGSGAAKNITAITQAYPPVVTSAGHGFAAGDRVTIAAVGGMVELNGNSYTVEYATTNTFVLKGVNATAYGAYTAGGTATPVAFTQVKGLTDLDLGSGKTSEIDVTDLDSTAKEFDLGLPDYGESSYEGNVDFSDAGQDAVRARFADSAERDFKITYSDGTDATFTGRVSGYGEKTGADNVVKISITIRKTGVTSWT